MFVAVIKNNNPTLIYKQLLCSQKLNPFLLRGAIRHQLKSKLDIYQCSHQNSS